MNDFELVDLLIKIAIGLGIFNLILLVVIAWKLHITHCDLCDLITRRK